MDRPDRPLSRIPQAARRTLTARQTHGLGASRSHPLAAEDHHTLLRLRRSKRLRAGHYSSPDTGAHRPAPIAPQNLVALAEIALVTAAAEAAGSSSSHVRDSFTYVRLPRNVHGGLSPPNCRSTLKGCHSVQLHQEVTGHPPPKKPPPRGSGGGCVGHFGASRPGVCLPASHRSTLPRAFLARAMSSPARRGRSGSGEASPKRPAATTIGSRVAYGSFTARGPWTAGPWVHHRHLSRPQLPAQPEAREGGTAHLRSPQGPGRHRGVRPDRLLSISCDRTR